MTATVGDRIRIESERVGKRDREGTITEVIDSPHGTRYGVRWDDGHESEIRPAAGSASILPADAGDDGGSAAST